MACRGPSSRSKSVRASLIRTTSPSATTSAERGAPSSSAPSPKYCASPSTISSTARASPAPLTCCARVRCKSVCVRACVRVCVCAYRWVTVGEGSGTWPAEEWIVLDKGVGAAAVVQGKATTCTEHEPCEMTYMPSAGSPCATITSSFSQRRSVIASRRSCSWSMRSDEKTETERRTLSMSRPADARRKLARLRPHRTPSLDAITDACRGLAYLCVCVRQTRRRLLRPDPPQGAAPAEAGSGQSWQPHQASFGHPRAITVT